MMIMRIVIHHKKVVYACPACSKVHLMAPHDLTQTLGYAFWSRIVCVYGMVRDFPTKFVQISSKAWK